MSTPRRRKAMRRHEPPPHHRSRFEKQKDAPRNKRASGRIKSMSKLITRRSVMAAGAAGAVGTLTTLPISMVRLAFGGTRDDFTFTYISDAHIQQIKGASFVRNWDMGLKRAVAEANLVQPESDFVMF